MVRQACLWWSAFSLIANCLVTRSLARSLLARPLLDESPKWVQPDYKIYHSKDQVLYDVDEIVGRNPETMRVEELHAGNETYAVDMKVVTVEPGGLTEDHSAKVRLLLNFGEHGRELVSSEVALRLLRLLSRPDELAGLLTVPDASPAMLEQVLRHAVFKIIPMENVRGRELVEGGALCERKNGRGVDTNRNWEVHWGFREPDYDPSEEYPGLHPFSEPEAALLRDLAAAFRPHVWLNVHSGMEALFMPYDHVARIPDGAAAQATLAILQELNAANCGGRCAVGSGGKSVGYLAHGTATDYMYQVLQVPLAFTWEIYGDMKAHYLDCFRMFNPLGEEALEGVVANWTGAVVNLLALLRRHPALHHLPFQVNHTHVHPTISNLSRDLSGQEHPAASIFRDDLGLSGGAAAGSDPEALAQLRASLLGYTAEPLPAAWEDNLMPLKWLAMIVVIAAVAMLVVLPLAQGKEACCCPSAFAMKMKPLKRRTIPA